MKNFRITLDISLEKPVHDAVIERIHEEVGTAAIEEIDEILEDETSYGDSHVQITSLQGGLDELPDLVEHEDQVEERYSLVPLVNDKCLHIQRLLKGDHDETALMISATDIEQQPLTSICRITEFSVEVFADSEDLKNLMENIAFPVGLRYDDNFLKSSLS